MQSGPGQCMNAMQDHLTGSLYKELTTTFLFFATNTETTCNHCYFTWWPSSLCHDFPSTLTHTYIIRLNGTTETAHSHGSYFAHVDPYHNIFLCVCVSKCIIIHKSLCTFSFFLPHVIGLRILKFSMVELI